MCVRVTRFSLASLLSAIKFNCRFHRYDSSNWFEKHIGSIEGFIKRESEKIKDFQWIWCVGKTLSLYRFSVGQLIGSVDGFVSRLAIWHQNLRLLKFISKAPPLSRRNLWKSNTHNGYIVLRLKLVCVCVRAYQENRNESVTLIYVHEFIHLFCFSFFLYRLCNCRWLLSFLKCLQ